MTGWIFALGGVAAGAVQARLLARSARGRAGSFSVLGRLLLVGAVLFLAALAGHLAAGALGWAAGFAATAAFVYRRLS